MDQTYACFKCNVKPVESEYQCLCAACYAQLFDPKQPTQPTRVSNDPRGARIPSNYGKHMGTSKTYNKMEGKGKGFLLEVRQVQLPWVTPHDVDAHGALTNAFSRSTSSSTHQPRSWSKAEA